MTEDFRPVTPEDLTPRTTVEMMSISKARYDELFLEISNYRKRSEELQRELSLFKISVRETTIAARQKHDLCTEGTNEFLKALGLTPLCQTYDVEGWVSGSWPFYLNDKGIAIDDVEITCQVPFLVRVDEVEGPDAAVEVAKGFSFDDLILNWDEVRRLETDIGSIDCESDVVEYIGAEDPADFTLDILSVEVAE